MLVFPVHFTSDSQHSSIRSCKSSGAEPTLSGSSIELDCSIADSGNIRITVKTKIIAKVVGSGSIYYKGKPKSVGSGSVIDKN